MARITKSLRYSVKKLGLDLPIDGRTKEFKNYLIQNGLTKDDYISTLKEIVKFEEVRAKERGLRIDEYNNKLDRTLTRLNTRGKVTIDYNEFLRIPFLTRQEYKKQIKRVFEKAKNYSNDDNRIVFRVNNEEQYYTITNSFINSVGTVENYSIGVGSDVDVGVRAVYDLEENPIRTITFEAIERTNDYKTAEGAYFPYYCPSYDLTRYQIFRNEDELDLSDNCLIYALRLLGLSEDKLDLVKTAISNDYVNKSKLKDICNELKICIELYEERNDNPRIKFRMTKIGKSEQVFKIALYENHYFIYEEFKEGSCSSLNFIKYLVNNKDKYLTPLDYSNIKNEFRKTYKVEFSKSLDYDDSAIKPKEFKEVQSKQQTLIFADFETYTDKNKKHIPYLLSIRYNETNEVRSFTSVDCVKYFIDFINKRPEKDLLIIFHNAKYDYNFLAPYICITNEINSEGHFKSLTGFTTKKVKITIKCSYNLFNFPLRDCPKLFMTKEEQLKIKKEVMPYDLYNEEGFVNIGDIPRKAITLKYFKSRADYNEFFDNCYEWECYDYTSDTIDIIRYSKIYCEMDVLILSICYNRFREWCLNDFKLDVNNYLTISSIADAYFTKEGCYEGVNQISLNVQNFIMKSVYGGRVMTANNQMIYVEDKINDFDAVSLYPSAMSRLSFPTGKPKVLKELNLEFLKTTDAYFVEIKITKVGIKRSFPILSTYDEGIRDYTNEMEGEIIIVNNITLEDLIKYHDIEFEIVRGYYYNEGVNDKIKDVIKYVFNKRVELKKKGNPAEIIYKLLMNSAYGKTIQKAHTEDFTFIYGDDKLNSFISKNYNQVISYQKIANTNCTKIKMSKSTFGFYNLAHVGSLILSMSKRIMNEVMTLAEDNEIPIYYQDTDSMHLKDADIPKLEKLFKETYNRDLIGKSLGQFHSDFNLPNAPKDVEVYSTKLIALGKKCYIDVLEGVDKKGKVYNGYHIRLKGVSSDSINHEANKRQVSELDLYELLYQGKEIEFDLTCDNTKKCFKFHKDFSVTTQTDFKRKIKFSNN